MSYDLFFNSRNSDIKIKVDEIATYFKQRKNYSVNDNQAIYQNQVTGVYFAFDVGVVENEEQPSLLPVSFNLNYYRPHIFGLEAEMEVKLFVQKFNLLVFDPQIDGMGEGEYSTEKFLAGWNKGNDFGYRAVLQQQPNHNALTLSTAQIENCWRWNFAQPDLQQKLGSNFFVPKIMFALANGKLASAVVWPDGIPSAVPEADIVIIPRKTILPKKMFGTPEDMVIASWGEVDAIIKQFPLEQGALPYRLLKYSKTPDSVVSQLRSFVPAEVKPAGVSVDKILNSELVTKARSK